MVSESQPNDSWVHISNPNPPPPPPVPATVVTGSGSDTLVLSISEDAYANGDGTSDPNGDAAFTVSVDGKQLAGTFYATASHTAGASQNFTLKGDGRLARTRSRWPSSTTPGAERPVPTATCT